MLIWDTCPKYTKLRQTVNSLPEVQKIQEDNKQLYKKLTNLTGMVISSPADVGSLYSTLTAEVYINFNCKLKVK